MSRYEDFRRDGAVCVRGAFSPEQVGLVERGIERNLAEPSERAMVALRPLVDELPAGAPMEHPLFPVVWP